MTSEAPTLRLSQEQLTASITRESFYDFLVEFWGEVIHETPVFNWHIEYLCQELQIVAERVMRGEPKAYDLIINIPPGSTKSTICSQMFPAWVWTRAPHARFICASYAQDVALRDAVKMRDILQSPLYQRCFPDLTLKEDRNTMHYFENTRKGFRLSAGLDGQIMAYHGHFIIIDDPLNPKEAASEATLKSVNNVMTSTLPSRKVDKQITPTILIQQRLHEMDPSGDMLERTKGEKVKHICLPGELTEHVSPVELRSRYVEGLLDPVRAPRAVLNTLAKELGDYGYAGQILQRPVPLGGGMFKTDKIHLVDFSPSKLLRTVRSWDKAGTEKDGAYSVGALMGQDVDGNFWILDVVRGQWGATERERNIKQTAELDGEEIPVLLEIEGGSGGKESGENTVRNLAGYRVITYHPTGDKEVRAFPFASQVGGGNVYCLKKEWTRDYLHELSHFPNGRFKDQVDASSGAFNYLAKKRRRAGGWKMKKR